MMDRRGTDWTAEIVKAILLKATEFQWSLQGFGMLRLHLTDELRLNLWDGRFRVPDVSLMHNHPWDFESLIVAGCLRNFRFRRQESSPFVYHAAVIKPGPGGGFLEQCEPIRLEADPPEVYRAGQIYNQLAGEIHISAPEDGTVTLNKRTRHGEDVATVYWPIGNHWVSAEPRAATAEEIVSISRASLDRWFVKDTTRADYAPVALQSALIQQKGIL